ncbi:MAG: hypothetical protein QME64_04145, partial [bacterium]|nr:hypothetical protein [bacterium]
GLGTSLNRYVYTVSTTATGNSITFTLDIYATIGGVQRHWQDTVQIPLVQVPQEIIYLPPPEIDDDQTAPSSGNGNGIVNANETIELYLNLQNVSWRTITGIWGSIATNSPYVTILQNYAVYGTLTTSQIARNSTAYVFSVSNAPAYTPITFTFTIGADGGYIWVTTFRIVVQPKSQAVWHLYYQNAAGTPFRVVDPNNGFAQPGETVQLPMTLYNSGSTLTNVNGQMFIAYGSPNNWVTITDNAERYLSDTSFNVYTISTTAASYGLSINNALDYYHTNFEWEVSGYDIDTVFHRWIDRMGITAATTGLISYAWDTIDDKIDTLNGTYGNGNGILEKGETILLKVGLVNNSDYPALQTQVTLVTPDTTYVTLHDPITNYGTIPAQSVRFNQTDPFKLYVSNTCPDNYVLNFNLNIVYSIATQAVRWAWDTTVNPTPPWPGYNEEGDGTIQISTTISFKTFMGSLNYYELRNRRYSLWINDGTTLNTSTTRANNDGRVNPGETVDIGLSLWNKSKTDDIGGIIAWLVPADSYTQASVTFLNATCNFSRAMPRSVATTVYPYFRITVAPEFAQSTMKFNLYITDSTTYLTRYNININIPVELGPPRQVPDFPIRIGSAIKSSPILIDVNQNGITDIVFGAQDGKVYVYEYDQASSRIKLLPGWPKQTDGAVFGSPAVDDLFGTGQNYVVAASMNGTVYIWDSTGNNLAGWPRTLSSNPAIEASPVLADIDADGRLEVIIAARQTRTVYAFDVSTGLKWYSGAIDEINSTPAVANVMNDPNDYLQVIYGSHDGRLHVIDHTGLLRWQGLADGAIYSSPVVGDLDNDGYYEIVVGCNDGKLYGWRFDGTPLPPINVGASIVGSPALGKLFGNETIAVVFATNVGGVYAYAFDGGSGNFVPLWQGTASDAINTSPAIGDINGDGIPEVVISCQDGRLYAYTSTGGTPTQWSWPLRLGAVGNRLESSPAIGDIMGFGYVSIVVGGNDGNLYAIDLSPAYYDEQKMEWPMFHHDAQHTGLYSDPRSSGIQDAFWITTNGSEQYLTFAYSGDVDWAKFLGKAGRIYRIQVTSNSPGVAIKFFLYAPDGKQIIGYSYSSLDRLITYTGIYYIKIINVLTGTGGYTISITDITPTSIPPELWKSY